MAESGGASSHPEESFLEELELLFREHARDQGAAHGDRWMRLRVLDLDRTDRRRLRSIVGRTAAQYDEDVTDPR